MPKMIDTPAIVQLLGYDTVKVLDTAFNQLEWAEDEIRRAIRRSPSKANELYHSFPLLKTDNPRMAVELVYRGHCRELLKRVVSGADTRPGTAAEVCCLCSYMSTIAPLQMPAMGLYFRMWAQAFPGVPVVSAENRQHYEALGKGEIDDLEAISRKKLLVPGRTLGEIKCKGLHHGVRVRCKYVAK
ncbi:hypothetical protein ALI22I_33850 [Saccharothrix sp. ALI-22-I]|nr:hypothetical protein ALI22I_33850 [Saccharothrix sp. ALI-22-I]